MTETAKIWRDMTDIEKGALLLADQRAEKLQEFWNSKGWEAKENGKPYLEYRAYRIKPKTPKVNTVQSESHVWIDNEGTPQSGFWHDGSDVTIANITHTYTITDGVVTDCNTIIHEVNT